MKIQFVIENNQDIDKMLSGLQQKNYEIKVNTNALTENENIQWSQKINSYASACGCTEGTVFIVYGMIFLMIFFCIFSFVMNAFQYSPFQLIKYSLCFIFCLGFIGKIFGILRNKILFRRALFELRGIIEKQ